MSPRVRSRRCPAVCVLAQAAVVVAAGLSWPAAPARAQAVLTAQTAQAAAGVSGVGDTVLIIGVSPLPGLGVARDRVPANVQAAGAAEIERSHAIDLSAFMGRLLGSVHINEVQGNPLQPDVNFRGYTASPILGSQQGLSIYLDGMRLNQPFGDVVSWDLVPKSAIASVSLVPGSNPLFGLNTLGGALSVQSKDGRRNPGSSMQVQGGQHGRAALEFETGGSQASGLHWFFTGNKFREDGWRVDSRSDVNQLFGKLGLKSGATDLALSMALARTDLNGNALQEQHELARDYRSVYTRPDITHNRAGLLNLALTQGLGAELSLSGNLYHRQIRTRTTSGDSNGDTFDQALYQPDAAEQAALAGAGYSGFPTAGETAANAPFPKWRCIANALLLDEPAEKCNGSINQTRTVQSQSGMALQLNHDGRMFGLRSQSLLGVALDFSRSRFTQSSELGYINPDRTITGVAAFGDGVNGGTLDGEPFDTRVDLSGRTQAASVYASSLLTLGRSVHLTLAGRYNRFTVKNRDAITPGGQAGSLDGDHRYSRFNPAVGLSFTPSAGLNLYAGLNQGSRAPSSVELGCADPANPCKLPNAFAGDPPLRQVVTTSAEAGLRGGQPGGLRWNLGVFRADNRDDLLFVSDDAAGFGYFKNFGKTRRQGVELGASLPLARGGSLGFNYTLLDATYRSAEVVDGSSNSSNSSAQDGFPGVPGTIQIQSGDRIPLVPRHQFKLYADLQLGAAWSVGADLNATSSALARGNENAQHRADGVHYLGAGRSAGFAVLNLSAEFRPAPGWKLFLQINNALDRHYASAAQLGATGFDAAGNFQARPFAADANGDRPLRHSSFLAPGAPRSVGLGLRYSWGGA